jgi:molecular chaperone DnaK
LGIETLGSVSTPLISRNTTIPTAKSQIFSTAADNQTQVEVNVLQGERPMAVDNRSLGRFILDGIPPAPRSVPQIEVAFDIDANGILSVTAKDKATGRTQSVTIRGSTGLSKDEIEKMTKEADLHATEDEAKRKAIETKNQAENLIYASEKTLKDAGDKTSAEDKKAVEEKMAALREALKTDNLSDIEGKTKELSETIQKVGASMYQQQSTAGGPQTTAEETKAGEPKAEESSSSAKASEDKVEEGEVVS